MNDFIGRKESQRTLRSVIEDDRPSLNLVLGRLHAGKSTLLTHLLGETPLFVMTARPGVSTKAHLADFAEHLSRAFGEHVYPAQNWSEAFFDLRFLLEKHPAERTVIVIDEFPRLGAAPRSGIIPALSHFWNQFGETVPGFKLILTGSDTDWMINNVLGDPGGLYGRVYRTIGLLPFSLFESETLLRSRGIVWSRLQILRLHMLTGGLPSLIDRAADCSDFDDAVRSLLSRDGLLRAEAEAQLLTSIRTKGDMTRALKAFADTPAGFTVESLGRRLGINQTKHVARLLEMLCHQRFVAKHSNLFDSDAQCRYLLSDPLMLFRFAPGFDRNRFSCAASFDELAEQNPQWADQALAAECLRHIRSLPPVLGTDDRIVELHVWTDEDISGKRPSHPILVLITNDLAVDLVCCFADVRPFAPGGSESTYFLRLRQAFLRYWHMQDGIRIVLLTQQAPPADSRPQGVDVFLTADALFNDITF